MLLRYEKACIYFLSFFSFAGYYAGLAIMFSVGLKEQSRLYSIPLRLLTAIVMIYILLNNIKKLFNNRDNFYFFLFLIFWIFYLIKVLWDTSLHGYSLQVKWTEYILFSISFSVLPFFAFSVIQINAHKKNILNAMILSGFLMGCICTFLYKEALVTGIGRLSDSQQDAQVLNPLSLSYAGSLTIVLCLYKLVDTTVVNLREKIYLYSTIVLSFIMFFLGASRGSVMALALSLPFMFFYLPPKSKFRSIILLIIAIPLVIWGSEATGSRVFKRTSSISSDIATGSTESSRIILWNDAIKEFIAHPVFGGRIELRPMYGYSGALYPHNIFLEVLMATGILGAILLFPVVFAGIGRIIKVLKRQPIQVWIFILLVQGLTFQFFSGSISAATSFFIPLGMCFANFKKAKI